MGQIGPTPSKWPFPFGPSVPPRNTRFPGFIRLSTQTASSPVQPFLHSSRQSVPISLLYTVDRPFPPNVRAHFYGRIIWTLSWPIQVHNPNRISIGSHVLAGLHDCDRLTAGLNFSGNARELSSLTFLTAEKQFPLKWTAQRERRVPNSSHRISGVW